MEQQTIFTTTLQTEAQSTFKRPYAPPKATFVPIKLEEKLQGTKKAGCKKGGSVGIAVK